MTVTAASRSLNEIFPLAMRWQQPFSYLRNPAMPVTFKPSGGCNCPTENFYRLCFFVVARFLFLSFLCSVSLSHFCFFFFFFFGRVQPWITFLLALSLPLLKWPSYGEVNRQTSQQSSGPNYTQFSIHRG